MYEKKTVGIEGYEEYQCDTDGVVYGKNGKPLKPNINQHGYKYVVLFVNGHGRAIMVHRIIAKTFVPNPNSEINNVVNHIDGNKLNNIPENLEWTTFKGNAIHASKTLGVNVGKRNGNAKRISGYDKKTGELKMRFDCLADAARYFSSIYHSDYRHIQNVISLCTYGVRKKSYRGMIWKYE